MTSFVIPHFFSAIEPLGLQSSFPVLARILSKSTIEAYTHANAYQLISHVLGAPEALSRHIAAVKYYSEMKEKPNLWICSATPVAISPNRDHLDMDRVTGFDISQDEAKSFCDEFNDYFKEDGFHFSFSQPDLHSQISQWYCQTKTGFEISSASPISIAGEDIAPHIPQGKAGAAWRKIFNEMQMLLHHSATNRKRSELGKPEINSFWFWGGGQLDDASYCDYTTDVEKLISDDVFARGLGLLGNANVSTANRVKTAEMISNSAVIANIDYPNWQDWDEKYFEPALQALKKGEIAQLTFYLDLERQFILKKSNLLKFWARDKAINQFKLN